MQPLVQGVRDIGAVLPVFIPSSFSQSGRRLARPVRSLAGGKRCAGVGSSNWQRYHRVYPARDATGMGRARHPLESARASKPARPFPGTTGHWRSLSRGRRNMADLADVRRWPGPVATAACRSAGTPVSERVPGGYARTQPSVRLRHRSGRGRRRYRGEPLSESHSFTKGERPLSYGIFEPSQLLSAIPSITT